MKKSRGKGRRDKKKEEEEDSTKVNLTKDMIMGGLQDMRVLVDKKSIGYSRLDLSNIQLDHVNNLLIEIKHLQYVNLSNNNLVDVPQIVQFENLQSLNLANNKIKHISYIGEEEKLPNLIHMDAKNNKITEFPGIKCPKLQYLDVSQNLIMKLDKFEGHGNLRTLRFSQNKLKHLNGLKELPRLEEAYFDGNNLNGLIGYENLPELKRFHLRGNRIEKFEDELPELPALNSLNLRDNKISSKEEVKKLFQFLTLKDINILENPFSNEENSYLIHEILIMNPKLGRINKIEITPKLQQDAIFLSDHRWRKSEEERIAREKADKEKDDQEEES